MIERYLGTDAVSSMDASFLKKTIASVRHRIDVFL